MQTSSIQGVFPAARMTSLASIALFAAATTFAQETEAIVGQRAPAFALRAHNGSDVSLDAMLKEGPAVLVFYRSADWCLFCKFQLIQLQQNLKEIEADGGRIVGISYDSPAVLKRFADRKKISLPLLSDREVKTIRAYGMNTPGAEGEWAGIAQHGTFVIDRQGIPASRALEGASIHWHGIELDNDSDGKAPTLRFHIIRNRSPTTELELKRENWLAFPQGQYQANSARQGIVIGRAASGGVDASGVASVLSAVFPSSEPMTRPITQRYQGNTTPL